MLPGEYLELPLPPEISGTEHELAIEPHVSNKPHHVNQTTWPPPAIVRHVGGVIRIPNNTDSPLSIAKHEHVCLVSQVFNPDQVLPPLPQTFTTPTQTVKCPQESPSVAIDPDQILTPTDRTRFLEVTEEFEDVFRPGCPGYNGFAGKFEAVVNMGPTLPPQRKGRLPLYNTNKLQELQQKFDDLEASGVFARPEEVGVNVEYVNPSFLVKKPNGSFRLVTAFSDVGRYSKPQPSLMPDVDTTLRKVSQWQYLIKTDLTSAFYQIPLSKELHEILRCCHPL